MSKTLIELLSVQFKFFLQQFFVNNLVVCPVYVQCFPIDHKLCHFRQIVRNFPIDIIPGKCGDRLATLGFDHHDPGLAEVALVLVSVAGNCRVVCKASAAALDGFLCEIHLRVQAVLHENTGVAAAFDLLAVYGNGDY